MTDITLDPLVIVPLIGAFVGILVGFITIYSSIKSAKQKARAALDKSIAQVKEDLKEYIDLNLEVMDIKVNSVRNEMKLESIFTGELNRRSDFFTKWVQRLEDRMWEDEL